MYLECCRCVCNLKFGCLYIVLGVGYVRGECNIVFVVNSFKFRGEVEI